MPTWPCARACFLRSPFHLVGFRCHSERRKRDEAEAGLVLWGPEVPPHIRARVLGEMAVDVAQVRCRSCQSVRLASGPPGPWRLPVSPARPLRKVDTACPTSELPAQQELASNAVICGEN